MEVNGLWVGWGLGDDSKSDFTVQKAKAYMRKMYVGYAGNLADTNLFDQQMQDCVTEMQTRLAASGNLVWGNFILGVLDLPTEYAMGFKKKPLPWIITVEGHSSNMFAGPCADTATQLMGEGRCYHQPTGYDNGKIPFDNASGVEALAANVRNAPADVDIYFICYSQGAIVVHDYLEKYGIPKNLKGVLFYGNPCRQLNSIASWAIPWVKRPNTHGLDPYKRFGITVKLDEAGIPYADVFREYDIFAQNGDDEEGQMKAAVYEAVARGDFFSNPYSLGSLIMKLFPNFTLTYIVTFVFNIMMASGSGIEFLADNPNPHYAPYNLDGGLNWMRGLLIQNG